MTDVLVDPFTEDQNHLHEHVLALVLDIFARHYTTFEPAGAPTGTAAPAGGLEDRLARVEQAYTERVQQLAVLSHRCAQLDAEVAALRQAAGHGGAGDSRRGGAHRGTHARPARAAAPSRPVARGAG